MTARTHREVNDMKAKQTVDAIGTLTVVGGLTVALAALGVVQVAAAGFELLVAAPLARRKTNFRHTPAILTLPKRRLDVRIPQAA